MLLELGTRLLALLGLKPDLARRFALVPIIIVAVLALWAAKAVYDRSVVENANSSANAEFREKQIETERELGAEKAERDAANSGAIAEDMEKVDEAEAAGRTAADDVWDSLWD